MLRALLDVIVQCHVNAQEGRRLFLSPSKGGSLIISMYLCIVYTLYLLSFSGARCRRRRKMRLLALFSPSVLADIWPSIQLNSNLFCKNIMHRVSWMQTVEPEVLVDRNTTSSIEEIRCRCAAENCQSSVHPNAREHQLTSGIPYNTPLYSYTKPSACNFSDHPIPQ